MAEPVNRLLSIAACCCALIAPQLAAANLPDPTSPPAAYLSGSGVQQGMPQPAAGGLVLQSVMISSGRRVAVISGQPVSQGGKYGDLQVVRISESEVVLQGSGGTQTLKLFPGVEKKMTSRANRGTTNVGTKGSQ
jgi:MSHA biogenesis protein MshK